MFGILMPPGHEDVMEDHYEDISTWNSHHIVATYLPNLLNDLMDMQFLPSKEMAKVYFANKGIDGGYSAQICDIEAIEMAKKFPKQLELAFCEAYADKLLIASRAMKKMLKNTCAVLCTEQLNKVVKHQYFSRDKAEQEENARNLWWEFQLELNKAKEDQTPKNWYYTHDRDPYQDNVIKNVVTKKEIKLSLASIQTALREGKHIHSKGVLKLINMHLLMIVSSLKLSYNPKAFTQHEYRAICDYVMNANFNNWTVWKSADDLDLAQVVMTRTLSRAVRSVAKFENAASNIAVQNLMQWFAVETFVTACEVRKAHKSDDSMVEVAAETEY